MNRKLIPLLAIAFVVAIICTGVFYGLFAGKLRAIAESKSGTPVVLASRNLEPGAVIRQDDLRVTRWNGSTPKGAFGTVTEAVGSTVILPVAENEPLTASRVATAQGSGGGLGVPAGMRAVSVRVSESSGVMELVDAGQKVDLQVFVARSDGGSQLRTLLQGVAVFGKGPGEGAGKPAVVTLLVTPKQADLVAFADASARLRLTLRNPLDKQRNPAESLTLASLLRPEVTRGPVLRAAASGPRPVAQIQQKSRLVSRRVEFQVRIIECGRPASGGLAAWLGAPYSTNVLRVAPLGPGFDAETELRGLGENSGLSIVSASTVSAADNREVSVQASDRSTAVRLRFVPAIVSANRVRLRVQPEVISSGWSQKIETDVELADGQSFVVTGLSPGGSGMGALLALVTPRLEKPVNTAALKPEHRLIPDAKP